MLRLNGPDFATNLRRLMARFGLTVDEVAERAALDARTLKGILRGKRPHARTLHKLADGLGVSADEMFQDPSLLARRLFDRATNPLVDEVVAEHPELFHGWREAEFDELYSRMGSGGALTREGALAAVEDMNRQREVHGKVALLLESGEAELLAGLVDVLYQRIVISDVESLSRQHGSGNGTK